MSASIARAARRHPSRSTPARTPALPRVLHNMLQRFYDTCAFDVYMATGLCIDPAERACVQKYEPLSIEELERVG